MLVPLLSVAVGVLDMCRGIVVELDDLIFHVREKVSGAQKTFGA